MLFKEGMVVLQDSSWTQNDPFDKLEKRFKKDFLFFNRTFLYY